MGPLGVPTHMEGLQKGGRGRRRRGLCHCLSALRRRCMHSGSRVDSIIGFRSRELLILEEEFKGLLRPPALS